MLPWKPRSHRRPSSRRKNEWMTWEWIQLRGRVMECMWILVSTPDGIPMSPMSNFSVNRCMYLCTYTSTILKSAPNSASQLLALTIAHCRKKGRHQLAHSQPIEARRQPIRVEVPAKDRRRLPALAEAEPSTYCVGKHTVVNL